MGTGFGSQLTLQAADSPKVVTSAAAAAPNVPSRNKSAFQGAYIVNEVHHFLDNHLGEVGIMTWTAEYGQLLAKAGSSPRSRAASHRGRSRR